MKALRSRFWSLAADAAERVFGWDSRQYNYCLFKLMRSESDEGYPW